MKDINWNYTKNPTGFLKEFLDTVDMFAYRDMPEHKLATGISMLSPYLSTKFRFGNFRPQVYCVSLAPSGLGKTRWTQFAKPFFEYSGFQHNFMGMEEFSSSVKFAESIGRNRSSLYILDEAGAFFKKIQSKNENAEVQVSQMLKKLYTIQGIWQGKPASGRSDSDAGVTWEPCPVCWFLLQPDIFQSHAGYDSVVDGLFGRCIYFVETEWNDLRDVQPKNDALRRSMQSLARTLTDNFGPVDYLSDSNLKSEDELNRLGKYVTKEVGIDKDALTLLNQIKHKFDHVARDATHVAEKALHGRAYDQLCRLLLLVAVTDDLDNQIIKSHHVAFSASVINDSIESILPLMIDASSVSRSDSGLMRAISFLKHRKYAKISYIRRDALRGFSFHEKDSIIKDLMTSAMGIHKFSICHSSKSTQYLTNSKDIADAIDKNRIGNSIDNTISEEDLENFIFENA